ncbi:hypothetical protein ACFO1B_30875 [Dactylosporangium siamense]|uniref:Uncharacterized protein n=1 Tax=Dactylosporangium siamense TaxID=685454 RepID=A0A919PQ70_9ACTN|nr:hypothetical protein [Dactylosporangium siamense]GIG48119.1 hypothetical protein Dsi01nite_061600 [Dactylosporangium siamense]
MRNINAAIGLLAGTVLGLLCGIPLGRHLERAGLAWWAAKLSLRTTWDAAVQAAGWLAVAVLILGAVAVLVWTA